MDALLSEERRWNKRGVARSRDISFSRWSMSQHLVAPLIAALIVFIVLLHFLYDAQTEPLLGHVAEEHELCTRGQSKQWCCGHRGARMLAPENTMAAFLTALQVGANCIEMDVHRTSDGKIAVVHGSHYRNKVLPANGYVGENARVPVEDTSWESLQRLDAGSWFDKKFQNERIPQLTSVLETFWDVDVRLIVELKAETCPPYLTSPKWEVASTICDSREPCHRDLAKPGLDDWLIEGHLSVRADDFLLGITSPNECQRLQKWEERYADSLKAALIRVQKDRGVGSPRFSLLFTSFNHSLVDQLALTMNSLSYINPQASRLTSGLGYILDPHLNYTGAHFKNTVTWLAPHVSKVTEVDHLWQKLRCVSSWVTDSRETIEQQFRLGVQAVTTNLPSLCPTIKLDN